MTDLAARNETNDAALAAYLAPRPPLQAPKPKGLLERLFTHPLCMLGWHRDKLASAGSTIVPQSLSGWGGGFIDVCRDCGRMLNHETKEPLTSPAALIAGQQMRDRSPFARLRCLVQPHVYDSHSAIIPEVSHWDECIHCDHRTNER